MTIKLTSYSKN